jgi:hypothetical protein
VNTDERFTQTLSEWLGEEAAHRVPDHLAEVLVQTAATRQRPWWSSLERLIPMTTMTTRRPIARTPVFWFAMLAILTLAVVGAALVVGALLAPRTPLGLPSNGRILVADGTTIVSYAADGTDRQELLRTTTGASGLSVSPDGTKVAFVAPLVSPVVRVVSIPDRTAIDIKIPGADLLSEEPVGWSPDSRFVTFGGFDGSHNELYVAAADGSSVGTPIHGQLAVGDGVFQPAYSPDGTWIAFASESATSEFTSLYVVHPDGTGLRALGTASVAIGDAGGPLWSPAAGVHRIAYLTSHAGPLFARIFDVDTGKDVEIGGGFWTSWSRDGTRLATCCINVTDVDDALAGTLTEHTVFAPFAGNCGDDPETWTGRSVCSAAVWSPDSQWLVGADIGGKDLLMARADGTGETRRIALTAGNTLAGPRLPVAWQPVWP